MIERAVGSCDVLIALIGRQWIAATDAEGRRRLDSANDFVRAEIAAALAHGIRVVPVLIHGASMPRSEDLPEEIRELAWRNAIVLSDAHFAADVRLLISSLRGFVTSARPDSEPSSETPEVATVPAPSVRRRSPYAGLPVTRWRALLVASILFAATAAALAAVALFTRGSPSCPTGVICHVATLAVWGREGTAPGEFRAPYGLALDRKNSDANKKRQSCWTADPTAD
jgi:hypothetical protein